MKKIGLTALVLMAATKMVGAEAAPREITEICDYISRYSSSSAGLRCLQETGFVQSVDPSAFKTCEYISKYSGSDTGIDCLKTIGNHTFGVPTATAICDHIARYSSAKQGVECLSKIASQDLNKDFLPQCERTAKYTSAVEGIKCLELAVIRRPEPAPQPVPVPAENCPNPNELRGWLQSAIDRVPEGRKLEARHHKGYRSVQKSLEKYAASIQACGL